MITARELLKQGKRDEIWEMYCGFLDLRLPEFIEIQRELLLEQIQLLSQCELGRKLLGNQIPQSVAAFRESVPLTTYEDYEPYLSEKNEDVMPSEIFVWARTSGKTGGDTFKWVPYSRSMYEQFGRRVISAMLVGSCKNKGEVRLENGDILLMTTAPPPYISAFVSRSAEEQAPVRFIPSLAEGEKMDFQDRIEKGFELAIVEGMDYFYGLASLLVKIGERFEHGSGSISFSRSMLKPNVLLRLITGFLKGKFNRRALRPSDIWKLKGIMTGGTDTDIYKDRIEKYWGIKPLEGYGSTEGFALAMQLWNFKGMTLYPDTNFYEFIPYEEHSKNKKDPSYTPKTILLDELQPGIYELVFTNFHGGIFTRYRIFDLIEVISLRDDELDIDIPQIRFYSRADDVIDLAGMVRLTEKTIWYAMESSGVHYEDWTARKEELNGEPLLHIYFEESRPNNRSLEEIKSSINEELMKVSSEYADLITMLGGDRLKLTRLPTGAFAHYMEEQKQAGVDMGILKPSRMQPGEEAIRRLMQSIG